MLFKGKQINKDGSKKLTLKIITLEHLCSVFHDIILFMIFHVLTLKKLTLKTKRCNKMYYSFHDISISIMMFVTYLLKCYQANHGSFGFVKKMVRDCVHFFPIKISRKCIIE